MALEGQSRISFNAAVYSNAAESLYRRHNLAEMPPLSEVQRSASLGSATERERPKDHHQPHDQKEARMGQGLDETVRHKLEQLALALGLPPISLDTHGTYRFGYNTSTGLIDLVETQAQTVVMSMSLKELATISQWLELDQVEGLLADRAG